jgi:hypothetical protein
MFQTSIQVIYTDADFNLQQFTCEIPDSPNKISVSIIEDTYDICYKKDYIEKTVLIRDLLNTTITKIISTFEKEEKNKIHVKA